MNLFEINSLKQDEQKTEAYHLAKDVLIVSSNEVCSRRLISSVDKSLNKSIGAVSNIEQAEKKILEKSPDFIFICLHLDGEFSGYEMAKILKMDYDIPFLLIAEEKNYQTAKWIQELNPDGAIYLNYSDQEIDEEVKSFLN